MNQLRWWDGARWTEYTSASSSAAYRAPEQSTVSPQTPVYNPFIWAIVFLPILGAAAFLAWDSSAYLLASMTHTGRPFGALAAFIDPGYLLNMALSMVLYVGSAVLAFLDWRKLARDGFASPFHWAWAFLSSAVYVIGRSVVVNKRAGRGLTPIWVWIAVTALTVVVIFIKVGAMISFIMSTIPSMSTYYTS